MQPKWDLPNLETEALAGPAGPKPMAMGCGRTITQDGANFTLRNLKKGSYWNLEASRFAEGTGSAAMTCEHLLFENGVRVPLNKLGPLTEYPASEDGEEDASDRHHRHR